MLELSLIRWESMHVGSPQNFRSSIIQMVITLFHPNTDFARIDPIFLVKRLHAFPTKAIDFPSEKFRVR